MRGKCDIDEIARRYGVESSFVEHIRVRFSKLDPSGVGAINDMESMIFQLDDFSLELYGLTFSLISDLKNHKKHIHEGISTIDSATRL